MPVHRVQGCIQSTGVYTEYLHGLYMSTEMYKIIHGVQAYDDMYDTESTQPYPFAVLLLFI